MFNNYNYFFLPMAKIIAPIMPIIKITMNIPKSIPVLKIPPTTVQELKRSGVKSAVKNLIALVIFI